MKKISLIIINYFTSHNIKHLLNSLNAFEYEKLIEIIIVNNSPEDVLINELPSDFKNVTIIESTSNLGFGAACNIGVKYSYGEYLAFVNPDITFIEYPFEYLINFIEKNKNVGVIGIKLLNEDLSAQYSYNKFPNFVWELNELFGISEISIEKKNSKISNSEATEVDWLIGAFMFMKKTVFDIVQGFDTNYFLYYEDTDLQKKIIGKGYVNYLLPQIKLTHGTKSSIKGDEGNKIYNVYMNKSKMIYYYKHSSFFTRSIVRLLNILRIFSRIVIFPIKLLLKKSSLNDLKILFQNVKVYIHFKEFYFK